MLQKEMAKSATSAKAAKLGASLERGEHMTSCSPNANVEDA